MGKNQILILIVYTFYLIIFTSLSFAQAYSVDEHTVILEHFEEGFDKKIVENGVFGNAIFLKNPH